MWRCIFRNPVVRGMAVQWVSSCRTHCPHCRSELQEPIYKDGKRQRGVVMCQIVAEPKTLQALHVVRWCGRGCEGKGVKYWCGFLERPVMIRQHRVLVKAIDEPHGELFFLNKSWGGSTHMAATMAVSDAPPQSFLLGRRCPSPPA